MKLLAKPFYPSKHSDVDEIIEAICHTGCQHVNEIIDQLQRGENIDELSELSTDEQHKGATGTC